MLNITILTAYPDMFPGYLGFSNSKRALNKLWKLNIVDIKQYGLGQHRKIDDTPYGGGKGLVLKADVLSNALESCYNNKDAPKLILPSPRGEVFKQNAAEELSKEKNIIFICGHFEGIDQRFIDYYNPKEYSIGDYILTGGEIASLVIIDSILRLLPNMINSYDSTVDESFSNGLLEYPQYTKPREWKDIKIPLELLSGHHENIKEWRFNKSKEKTKLQRPDLWEIYYNKLKNNKNGDNCE